VVLFWGGNWPVMKVALGLVPALWLTALRLLLGAAALFIAVAFSGNLSRPGRRDLLQLFSGGILQLALYMAFINMGLRFVPAGRAAVLAYTTPLWVVPGAMIFLGERLNRLKLLGLILRGAGLLALFNPFALDWRDGRVLLGNLLLMASALVWAAAMLLIRGRPWHLTPLQLAPWQGLLAGLLVLPFAMAFEGWRAVGPTARLVAILLYTGPVCTGFCVWAVLAITRALPAVTSSLSFLAVPVFGLVASTLALGEAIDPTLIGGLILILGGVALVAYGDRRRS